MLTHAVACISFKISRGRRGPDRSWKSKRRFWLGRCGGHEGGLALAMPAVPVPAEADVGARRPLYREIKAGPGRAWNGQWRPRLRWALCRTQGAGRRVTAPWGEAGATPGPYPRATWLRRRPPGESCNCARLCELSGCCVLSQCEPLKFPRPLCTKYSEHAL